jgi:amidase
LGKVKPSELVFSSAIVVAKAIRYRKVSSFELTKHILERIDRFNPSLNAIVTLMESEALDRAQHADEALAKGEIWGPLHGVPITIKDCFDISGVRTTAGSRSMENRIPEKDAVAVARLKSAGAVIIGHTNVPVWAGDWQSYNKIFGITNNPWDYKRTPGGSTGGGATAIAAALSFLSLGSDVGGSIRIPAHFCGVYGHKPSVNVVPLKGYVPYPPYSPQLLYVGGPLARSAEDLKLAMEILGGPDVEEAVAFNWSLPPERRASLSDYKLGYVLDHPACPISSEVKDVIVVTLDSLKNEGVDIVEGWPIGVNPLDNYTTFRFLFGSLYAPLLKDENFDETRMRSLDQDGSYVAIRDLALIAPHKRFQQALKERREAQDAWRKFYRTRDAFLLPTSFLPAFPHDHSQPFYDRLLSTPEGPRKYEELMFWISFATLCGLPATIAPIGKTNKGLPVGIQIIGPYLEDATPIDVAAKIAKVIGGFEPPPDYK